MAVSERFKDNFSADTNGNAPSKWVYGNNSINSVTLPAGDTFSVKVVAATSTSPEMRSLEVNDVKIASEYSFFAFHTNSPINLSASTDKILQLNADLKVLNNGAYYRIGLYHSTTNIGAFPLAYELRINTSAASNNVQLITTNSSGTAVDNTFFSVSDLLLKGTHTFALQVDYTASTTTPKLRAYSNGTLLGEITVTSGNGFPYTASAVRILATTDCFNTGSTAGGKLELSNITLTSFTPGTILLGQIQNSGDVNAGIFGHSIIGGADNGIFSSNVNTGSIRTADGIWDPVNKITSPIVKSRCRDDLAIRVLRYPGGCLVHNFDWKGTIGPIASRAKPRAGIEDWFFGVDEFMTVCTDLDAEPVFTCSEYLLPADQMPEHLANLVEYLNAPAIPSNVWAMKRKENGHEAPYGVRYFEMGNESMHGNHLMTPARVFTAAQYADYFTSCAAAMRAVDPTISLGIVTYPGGGMESNSDWNIEVMQAAGRYADFAVLHLYSPKYQDNDTLRSEEGLMQATMAVGEQIEQHLTDYHAMISTYAGHDLPLAITEYNSGFFRNTEGTAPGSSYRFSYGSALQCADLMRIFMKPANGVLMSNYWQFLNSYFGMLSFSDLPPTSTTVITERPAYPLFRLWGKHFGTRDLNVAVTSPTSDFVGERRVYTATGSTYFPESFISSTNLMSKFGSTTSLNAISGNGTTATYSNNILSVTLNNYTGNKWPGIGDVSPVAGTGPFTFSLRCEAKYTSTSGAVPTLNLVTVDVRNWSANSQYGGAATGSLAAASDWSSVGSDYDAMSDAAAVEILLGLVNNSGSAASGTLQIKNAIMDVYKQPVFPEYALLTAAASKSTDGKTAYLVVFNKSNLHIPSPVNLNGFTAVSAKRWEVNGPGLAASSGVSEVVSGQAFTPGTPHVFPAHSMTVIEFYLNTAI